MSKETKTKSPVAAATGSALRIIPNRWHPWKSEEEMLHFQDAQKAVRSHIQDALRGLSTHREAPTKPILLPMREHSSIPEYPMSHQIADTLTAITYHRNDVKRQIGTITQELHRLKALDDTLSQAGAMIIELGGEAVPKDIIALNAELRDRSGSGTPTHNHPS